MYMYMYNRSITHFTNIHVQSTCITEVRCTLHTSLLYMYMDNRNDMYMYITIIHCTCIYNRSITHFTITCIYMYVHVQCINHK